MIELGEILLSNDDNFFLLKGLSSSKINEIKEVINLANDFCSKVVIPRVHKYEIQIDKNPDFLPSDFIHEANRWQLFSKWLPKAFGGGGFSPLSMHFFNEILASHCMAMTNMIGVHYVGLTALSASMNYKMLQNVCKKIKAGEKKSTPHTLSIAVTEPEAGTDLEDHKLLKNAKVGCTLIKSDGGYTLNGTKIFISNGHLSHWSIVTAFLDKNSPHTSQVSVLVSKDSPGFSHGKIERKLGQKSCTASELIFDNVFISADNVIFSKDHCPANLDFEETAKTFTADVLNLSRTGVGSIATGISKSALDLSLKYCREQKINGVLMGQIEWVQIKLAKMHNNIYLSRNITFDSLLANDYWGPFKEMSAPVTSFFMKKVER